MENSRNQDPNIISEISHQFLSNSIEDYTSLSKPRTCSSPESVTDINASFLSTDVLSEQPHTPLNSSNSNLNTNAVIEDVSSSQRHSFHETGIPISLSTKEKLLHEVATKIFNCDACLSEQSYGHYPENVKLLCLASDEADKRFDPSSSSQQNSYVERDPDVQGFELDSEDVQSLDKDSVPIRNESDHECSSWNENETTDISLSDQQTTTNTKYGVNENNKLSPFDENISDQDKMDIGQAPVYCVNLSSRKPVTENECGNTSTDQKPTEFTKVTRTYEQPYDSGSCRNNLKNEHTNENQGPQGENKIKFNSEQLSDTADLNIHHSDTSHVESLLTKEAPDTTMDTDTNPVLQEALARRDAMVKDLSVDGSGLKVMCCLLGVIVLFAIAIITIVITGL